MEDKLLFLIIEFIGPVSPVIWSCPKISVTDFGRNLSGKGFNELLISFFSSKSNKSLIIDYIIYKNYNQSPIFLNLIKKTNIILEVFRLLFLQALCL